MGYARDQRHGHHTLEQNVEGTMMADLYDAKSQSLMWRAIAQNTLNNNGNKESGLKPKFVNPAASTKRRVLAEILVGASQRWRISYVDGFPVGDPEIVFKFRHPDEQQATAMDVRPKIAGHK
jgi:hypothetical protein